MDNKEMFMAAHEELVAEYLEKHPNATDARAYDATADQAWDRMRENIFSHADYLRMKSKEADHGK